MNRQHPYGGYDAGPNDRGNRPTYDSNAGYPGENASGGYYPAGGPPPQQQPLPPQRYAPPPMNMGQNDYQGGPNRAYPDANAYPATYSGGQNAPPGAVNGSRPAITLGPGPLNNQSQYGTPMRYDGGAPPQGGQSPSLSMNSYGSSSARPPTPQHYTAESAANPSRSLPAPMRQSYDSHLPQKPDSGYASMPPRGNLSSPPAHLPRPPGRDWGGDDQSRKRARRDGSNADEGKESDEIIRERIKRERPCRTLFVRNIEFNADVEDLRRRFEAFGEIKSYFDLTSKRGLLFISYYDLRSAERAKASMQEFVVNGRKVDVHYSLPRESDMTKRCDRDKDQGTLFILLKKAQGELNDDEVRATFAQFGEIKSLRRYKDQGNCRFLEYYDCRACKAAHDAMFGTTWNGGTWDMKFAWDAAAPERIAEPSKGMQQQQPLRNQGYGSEYGSQQHQSPVPGGAPGWGGQPQRPFAPPQQQGPLGGVAPGYPPYGGAPAGGQNYNAPPANAMQGTKRPYDYDEQAAPEPPMRRWGQAQGAVPTSYGQSRPPMDAGYGGVPAARPAYQPQNVGASGQGDYGRYGADQNEYGQQQQPRYGAAPPLGGGSGYSQQQQGNGMPPQQRPPPPPMQQQQAQNAAAPPPATSNDDRLEQAQKVQQLLASLKPGNLGGNNAASTPAPTSSSTSQVTSSSTPAPSLPSNIAALLQMAQANAAKK